MPTSVIAMPPKLSAMIIGSNLDVRMRLLHAVKSVIDFGKCDVQSSLSEATAKLRSNSEQIDIIFLSYEFACDNITEFAKSARTFSSSRDGALIKLLPANTAVDDSLSSSLMAGTDGFLIEPYSCDDLVEIAHLSSTVKKGRESTREIVAARFLVKDIIRLLDAMYCLKRCQVDLTQTQEKFKQACARVPELGDVAQKVYLDLLVEGLERSLEPIAVKRNAYKGKSERTRRRVENMLINKYETNHKEEVIDRRKGVMMNGKFLRLPPLRTEEKD